MYTVSCKASSLEIISYLIRVLFGQPGEIDFVILIKKLDGVDPPPTSSTILSKNKMKIKSLKIN